MKTIGMLGGMSWESTALYYRVANELVRERRGGLASADLLVRSLDFEQVRELQLAGRWSEAADLLLQEAKALEAAGAELVVLCTNYMHKTAPVLEAGLGVPFLHIADVVAQAALARGVRRVGLTGAGATMAEPFYTERLARSGLEVLVPDAADRDLLDRAVFGELCRGVLSQETRGELRAVLGRLVEAGAEAVVLGCTELELLLVQDDCAVPLLPSARLHVAAAVDAALA
ncbi:MAG TPA: amino acid racemase [Mycobacteriales bacterium]|jgi:aspartate racemase|nr:amino acid racemase [Mycobacteriales bacterium]